MLLVYLLYTKFIDESYHVGPPMHISLNCVLGWCLVAGPEVSFISMSGKSDHPDMTLAVYWDV